jgi:hypothetical protein
MKASNRPTCGNETLQCRSARQCRNADISVGWNGSVSKPWKPVSIDIVAVGVKSGDRAPVWRNNRLGFSLLGVRLRPINHRAEHRRTNPSLPP